MITVSEGVMWRRPIEEDVLLVMHMAKYTSTGQRSLWRGWRLSSEVCSSVHFA